MGALRPVEKKTAIGIDKLGPSESPPEQLVFKTVYLPPFCTAPPHPTSSRAVTNFCTPSGLNLEPRGEKLE